MDTSKPTRNTVYIDQFDANFAFIETNILRHPIALLGKRNKKTLLRKTVDTEQSQMRYDFSQDGKKYFWHIIPSAVHGYPDWFAKRVLVAVLALIHEDGYPPNIVWKLGSCSRICKFLGISTKGPTPGKVRKALELFSVTGIRTNHFWLKESKSYCTGQELEQESTQKRKQDESKGISFTLWSVIWKDEELPTGEKADSIYLTLNLPFILSLQSFFVKPFNYSYWLLKRPVTARLYELTGLKFYGLKDSKYSSFNYLDLCSQMPISPRSSVEHAQRDLQEYHSELQADGWLEKWTWIVRKENGKPLPKSDWKIRYYPGILAKKTLAEQKKRYMAFMVSQKKRRDTFENADERSRIENLVVELERATGDTHSRGGFWRIAENIPEQVVWKWISEIKVMIQDGQNYADSAEIKKPGSIVIGWAQEYAAQHQIALGFDKAQQRKENRRQRVQYQSAIELGLMEDPLLKEAEEQSQYKK